MGQINMCRFCNIIDGKYYYKQIDQPFFSNDKFIAIASIGAIIEGWSLVIPKEHQLSIRNLYKKAEFIEFLRLLIPVLINYYGPLIVFEHGSNKEGSITACGTDHAHLHLVPFRESLLPEIQSSNLHWIKCHTSEIAEKAGNREYLFYSELRYEKVDKVWEDPVGYLHILKNPISQFFRHLIANRLGCAEVSDYRRFPCLETAMQTHRILAISSV